MNYKEQEREIKKELRASMNGVLSARMREAGMPFHLIFGTELPRLRCIAEDFPKDADLAILLWQQSIRETRLLAIMLMPPKSFNRALADEWAATLQTAEEAQVMAMMLLSHVPYAVESCVSWLCGAKPLPATCACLCLRHLMMRGFVPDDALCKTLEECQMRLSVNAGLHLRKALRVLSDALIASREKQSANVNPDSLYNPSAME